MHKDCLSSSFQHLMTSSTLKKACKQAWDDISEPELTIHLLLAPEGMKCDKSTSTLSQDGSWEHFYVSDMLRWSYFASTEVKPV